MTRLTEIGPPLVAPAAAGLLFAMASFSLGSYSSLGLGLLSAVLLAGIAARERGVLAGFFVAGLVFHGTAFYWIPETIRRYGGLNETIAWLGFAAFCVFSSLQFVLAAAHTRLLNKGWVRRFGLALPTGWVFVELFFPRVFPWYISSPAIADESLSGLAEYVGAPGVSFLILWAADCAATLCLASLRQKRHPVSVPLISLGVALALGGSSLRASSLRDLVYASPAFRVGLIQSGMPPELKASRAHAIEGLRALIMLSGNAVQDGADVVIWPETALGWPLRDSGIRAIGRELAARFLAPGRYLIAGAILEMEVPTRRMFNAAVVVDSAGFVVGSYRKRVLMPFGEYVPLAGWLPMLRSISPAVEQLAAGGEQGPLEVEFHGTTVELGALICYEDMLPSLTRDAARRGAKLLLSLSEDGWFGDSPASRQHHWLSAWRAVEARRFLVRATTSGTSGIVDPFGRTVASLEVRRRGYAVAVVRTLQLETVFARYGNMPVATIVALISAVGLLCNRKEIAGRSFLRFGIEVRE